MWKRRHIQAYVPSSTLSPADQTKKNEEEEIEQLRKELEFEQKSKDTADWSNEELERSVRAMERNVQALIGGKIWIGTFNLPNSSSILKWYFKAIIDFTNFLGK